jgi:methylated-DNA-protein-cysteine methyltransferase related protein
MKRANAKPVRTPVVNASFEAIYAAIERIPRGRVATYGGIALAAGLPRRARLVGTALRAAPRARKLPWHRVLTASGKLAFPANSDAYALQASRLKREGVPMSRQRVDLNKYGWPSRERSLDELLWRQGD